jgi:tRNA A-37 threonylcarbamoyl transferase component Bud32
MATTQSATPPLTLGKLWQLRRHALRASDTLERIEDRGLVAVLDRTLCDPASFRELAKCIDQRMSAGQVFKDTHESQSTYVARLSVGGRDLMVKRYNHKGLVHSLGRTIQRSRARHNWRASHVLRYVGIGAPRPCAFLEFHRGPIVWQSYFLCEYVGAPSLYDILEQGQLGADELTVIAGKVHQLLRSLARWRISHGDLKLENILLDAERAIIIDLDGIRFHRTALTYRLGRRKDRTIFWWHTSRYPQFEAAYDALKELPWSAGGTDAVVKRGRA